MNSFHDMRMKKFRKAGIYFVTSELVSEGRATLEIIKAALEGGIKLIQLREKDITINSFVNLALEARKLTASYDALLIVNDRPDVAMACGADGVHLGQNDFPFAKARRLAPDLIIGASTHTVKEAKEAEAEGASYINIGPIFETGTKKWNEDFIGIDGIKEIASAVNIPFTVMGGIKKEHIPELRDAGAEAIALITAITGAADPTAASEELLSAFKS
jgi:thiamine-phosphate pyrophosphorylase